MQCPRALWAFMSELSILSSARADIQRLGRTGINSAHVYSDKRRTNSKRGEVQAVRGAVVCLCTVSFVVITATHMAANCGHAECGSWSLLLRVLIETVHDVSTCFFWDYLHTRVLQLDSKFSNVSQYQVRQMYVFCGKYSEKNKKMSKYTLHPGFFFFWERNPRNAKTKWRSRFI